MPDDAHGVGAGATFPSPASSTIDALEAPPFPADTRVLALKPADWARGGMQTERFALSNAHPGSGVLHVRLTTQSSWLSVAPAEVALGPGETQHVLVRVNIDQAHRDAAVAPPVAPVQLVFQRLFPAARHTAPSPTGTGMVYLRLPLAACPHCRRALDDEPDQNNSTHPDVCPFCFERLRACPVCHAPNSWLATRCVLDPNHVVRDAAPWPTLGGGASHTGGRVDKLPPTLSRRWSFPSTPPARRENALAWSAPVAAYGLVTAAGATSQGEAHLYAFDALTGAPLWEPFPLPDPVYPERGGAAIAGGKLFAATVEGVCVCVDALRGTRVWETALPGRVFGAVVPTSDEEGPLLVPVATKNKGGALFVLDAATGAVRHEIALSGPPDSAPAAAGGGAFVHDDNGALSAIDLVTGAMRWSRNCEGGFDAAPVLSDGRVFSATTVGTVFCHDAGTGAEVWRLAVTNAPFAGTPAHDGALLYLPADDGVHLVGSTGRAVRRYGLRQPVRSAPIVSGGTLFFASQDGNVYGVENGRALQAPLYETGVGSQIVAAPALESQTLFVVATNGVLYALSAGSPSHGR